jgi:hypothetical protein
MLHVLALAHRDGTHNTLIYMEINGRSGCHDHPLLKGGGFGDGENEREEGGGGVRNRPGGGGGA